jgi:hypothetical protein
MLIATGVSICALLDKLVLRTVPLVKKGPQDVVELIWAA